MKPNFAKQPYFGAPFEVEGIESRYKRLKKKYIDLKIKYEYQQNVLKRIKDLTNRSIFENRREDENKEDEKNREPAKSD